MTKKVKLFIVDEKPYLVSLDEIKVGDNVIVTVGGQYPSIVECKNEQILKLITDSKLKLTQPYKIFLEPEKITLNQKEIDNLIESDGVLEIEIEGNEIKYNL
jgi:hypothetical protein